MNPFITHQATNMNLLMKSYKLQAWNMTDYRTMQTVQYDIHKHDCPDGLHGVARGNGFLFVKKEKNTSSFMYCTSGE